MTGLEVATLGLGLASVVILPTLAVTVRGAIRWAKVESKVDALIEQVKELVINKDKTHLYMAEMMREDRAATNTRLRWLEENLWKDGKDNAV